MPDEPLLTDAIDVDSKPVVKTGALPAGALVPTAPNVPEGRADLMELSREERHLAFETFYSDYQDYRKWLFSKMKRGVHYGNPPGCDPKKDIPPEQWTARGMFYKAGSQFVASLHCWIPSFEADTKAWEMGGKVAGAHYRICYLHKNTIDGPVVGMGNGMAQVGQKNRDGNAAIKCANKCALSDAVLNRTGLSDLFVQDGPPGTEEPEQGAPAGDKGPQGDKPPATDTNNVQRQTVLLCKTYHKAFVEKEPQADGPKVAESFHKWAESVLQREFKATKDLTGPQVAALQAWFRTNGLTMRAEQ